MQWKKEFTKWDDVFQLIGSLSNHNDDGNKTPTVFDDEKQYCCTLCTHVHLLCFDILKTFSFFLRRGMACFEVVWRTWAYDEKRSILSYVPSAGSKLIPGRVEDIFQAQWLWIIEKLLQERDVLASVDVVFA